MAWWTTDKIVAITKQQFDEIHHQFGVGKTDQFQIITLGIDLTSFAFAESRRDIFRRELKIKEDELLIGLVGRLTEIKNHSLFLQTIKLYKELTETNLPKLRFLIIGDGNLRQKLENEAEESGITDMVNFLGNRNDPEIFYAGLDIVALTSLNEGTPLSLIEGMANAKPAVSTTVGGVVDLLGEIKQREEGFEICERGVSISSNSPEDYLRGLIYLAKDEQLRNRIGNQGKEFVFAKYSKETLVDNIKNLYTDLSV